MNKLWTCLNNGQETDFNYRYARMTFPEYFTVKDNYADELDFSALSTDKAYQYYYIEKTVQLCFSSPLKQRFEIYDKNNTYKYTFAEQESNELAISSDPSASTLLTRQKQTDSFLYREFLVQVVPSLKKAAVNGVETILDTSEPWTNPIILCPSCQLHLRNPLPSNNFTVTVSVVRIPEYDIQRLLNQLTKHYDKWTDAELMDMWLNGNSLERLTAFLYNRMVYMTDERA